MDQAKRVMHNGLEQAFPADENCSEGLTKREYIAARMLQAIVSSDTEEWQSTPNQAGKAAVKYADALLAALEE